MRPLLDNPPSSYRTEKKTFVLQLLLASFLTLVHFARAQRCWLDSFKSRSSKIHFYWQIFITVSLFFYSLFYWLFSLRLYIIITFSYVFFVLWHFRSIPFSFHNCCVFCSVFFAWCFAFTSQNQHTQYTMKTDRR